MDTHELREAFLRFFEERGHRRTAGAPIVPPGDPTLLFTSAGMVQFKPYFMGQSKPPHTRLASVQKCFRTTDIESVGDTKHLTFFEMLGNFSIGDYFKAEMIPWAWEFVTDVLKLPPERLWTSVYLDDDEAYALWRKLGVPEERIRRYGEEENYWFSGDIGPCGPCSEIYYDFGEQFGCGPACEPSHECGRFLEIWNLVFMSYYCDGEKRTPLPSRNIDTGSGLERVATVLLFESEGWDKSHLASPYDTDLFAPIIGRIEQVTGASYGAGDAAVDRAIRIVAEHARAVVFLLAEGIRPSNEGRGYVLRRMMRRAIYHARVNLLKARPILGEVADAVIAAMWRTYPELRHEGGEVVRVIRAEEESFWERLRKGQNLLEGVLMRFYDWLNKYLSDLVDRPWRMAEEPPLGQGFMSTDLPESLKSLALEPIQKLLGAEPWKASEEKWRDALDQARLLPGKLTFALWDTYGIPLELTEEVARQSGFSVDRQGFEETMSGQRARARAARKDVAEVAHAIDEVAVEKVHNEPFVGYESLEAGSEILTLSAHGKQSTLADEGNEVEIVLVQTPFYPEGGGQVGDRGEIVGPSGRVVVEDTQRVAERLIVHRGRVVEGRIAVGDEVTARVDARHRADTMRNHTATHLLHAALRKMLGTHVKQAGSLVAPDRLRFDFTHTEPATAEQLAEVERLVNEKVRQNLPVHTRLTSFDEAVSEGVLHFFGEKYGEEVRVVEVNTVIPRFSAELCGGTHCERTGDVGMVIITGESSIGAGMRRIEALSGRGAEEYVRQKLAELDEASRRVGGGRVDLIARIDALVAERDALQKRAERLERSLASGSATDQIASAAIDVDGVKVLASQVDLPSLDALRYSADAVRKTMPSGVAVLASVIDGRPQFVAIVSPDVIPKGPKAGEILKRVAAVTGGGGGGQPEMAQGGGKDASKIGEALAIVPEAVREMMSSNGPHDA